MIEDSINNLATAINRLADALSNKTDATQDTRLAALESKTAALAEHPTMVFTGNTLINTPPVAPVAETSTPEPLTAVETPAAPEITHDDLRALAKKLIEKDGNPKRFKAYLLGTHSVETLSHIPYADLDRAHADLTNLIQS